jgi:WD40 repeat protein
MSGAESCCGTARLQQMLEGTLPPDEQATVVEHLENCLACQTKYEELSASMRLIPEAGEKSPGPGETALHEVMEWLEGGRPVTASEGPASAAEEMIGQEGMGPDTTTVEVQWSDQPGQQPSAKSRLDRWVGAGIALVALVSILGVTETTGMTRLAATVIRVFRPEGPLETKVDDPGVQVAIDGESSAPKSTGGKELRATKDTQNIGVCTVGDIEGNLEGDKTRKYLDIVESSVQRRDGRYILSVKMAESFPGKEAMAGGKCIDVIWWVDIDQNRQTGQDDSGNDYNIHVHLDENGWDSWFFKVSDVSTSDGIDNRKDEFHVDVNGAKVSLSFPERYLPSKRFDWWTSSSSENAPRWLPVTRNPVTERRTFEASRGTTGGAHAVGDPVTSGTTGRKEQSVDREKDGRSVDSAQRSDPAQAQPLPSVKEAGTLGAVKVEPVKHDRFALGNTGQVSCVVFSPDGRTLAAGAAERQFPAAGIVKVWDVTTGRELATFRQPGEIHGPNGGSSSRNNYIWSLAFSPDGKTLAAGTELDAKVWDVASGRELAKLPGSSVEFSPDGKTLATVSHSVKLWDASTWQERVTLSAGSVPDSVAFSPDGKTVAVAEILNRLRLFDVATGQEQAAIHAEMGPLYGVAFSPDGNTVAATGEGGAKRWDIVRREGRITLQEKGRLVGHFAAVGRVIYSPDRKLMATASRSAKNGVVILSDVPSGQPRAILRDTNACAFSPDGKTLATGGFTQIDGKVAPIVKLWDVAEVMKPEVVAEQAKAAASEFIKAVRDSGFEQDAGRALTAIVGQEAAVPVLSDGLNDPDFNVRGGAVFALRLIGPAAIPALVKALKDEDARVRAGAAQALGQFARVAEAVVPALEEALKDADARVRGEAAGALGRIGRGAEAAAPAPGGQTSPAPAVKPGSP